MSALPAALSILLLAGAPVSLDPPSGFDALDARLFPGAGLLPVPEGGRAVVGQAWIGPPAQARASIAVGTVEPAPPLDAAVLGRALVEWGRHGLDLELTLLSAQSIAGPVPRVEAQASLFLGAERRLFAAWVPGSQGGLVVLASLPSADAEPVIAELRAQLDHLEARPRETPAPAPLAIGGLLVLVAAAAGAWRLRRGARPPAGT